MNRTVPPFKKPAFWVILAAADCVVLGVLLLPHRSGPTQLGTSQAEPTVAYADGTAYAIQLDDQILIRSSSKKWTERDLPSTYIWDPGGWVHRYPLHGSFCRRNLPLPCDRLR